ncbi:hypothetical protein [Streptomyces griseochromogenes]
MPEFYPSIGEAVGGQFRRGIGEHSAAPRPSHPVAPTANALPEQELPR